MSDSLDSTVIQFDGPDVRQVLQGQTTRNFATAGIQTPLMGAFCDLKGRVLTDFLAFITDDSQVLMRVHSSVADKLLGHLKIYQMQFDTGTFKKNRLRNHTKLDLSQQSNRL